MNREDGFTLIEVLVVIFFLAVLSLVLVSVFVYGFQISTRSEQNTLAVQIGQEELEFIRNMPFTSVASYVSSTSDFIQANLGTGERYSGYDFTNMKNIASTLTMEDDLGDSGNIIKLTATITWDYKGVQMRKDVVTYVMRGGINREDIH